MTVPTNDMKSVINSIIKKGEVPIELFDLNNGSELTMFSSGSLAKLHRLDVISKKRVSDRVWQKGKFYGNFCSLVDRMCGSDDVVHD